MPEKFNRFLETAVDAARKAGAYLLENRGKLASDAIDEKAKNDYVTVVDKTSEALIIDLIQSQYPHHSILAEEGGGNAAASDYQWIIDPLDGTNNFVRNLPMFCVSIAVRDQKGVIAGAVFDPLADELFSAVRGGGAYLNGAAIHVGGLEDFSRAFLATGFPHQRKTYLPQFVRSFSEIYYYSGGVRRMGSAALDLCYTACGRFDGYWELGLNKWDIAAGSLIVQEAGGMVSDFHGGETYLDSGFLIAGNHIVNNRLKEILSVYFGGASS